MYKQLLFVSTLSLGLAVAPAAMAQSSQDHRHGSDRDRAPAAVVDHRDDRGRNDSNRWSENRRDDGDNDRHDNDRHDNDRRGDDRHDNARNDNDRRGDDRHDNGRHEGWNHDRDDNHRERQWQGARYRVSPYHAPRGYAYHSWRAGQRLPSGYRKSRYVVQDYRTYRLYNPPRGHQWVRVDHDVVLTAIATGVVAAVVYGIFQ